MFITWRSAVMRLALSMVGILALTSPGMASQSTFQPYGTEQGLASLGGDCMVQDHAGYLLVCTEHGIFAYDGRRFANLGAAQGLRVGGDVFDLAVTSTGRVAVRYADELFVSDEPSAPGRPPTSLHFQPVPHAGISFYEEVSHHLVPWRGGLALLADGNVVSVSTPATGPASVVDVSYDPDERKSLKGGIGLFVIRGRLWETFGQGRICAVDPGAVKCLFPGNRMKGETWFDVVDGPGGTVLARSSTSVVTLDPEHEQWSMASLPDQGSRYDNYTASLGLYRAPDGTLFTQADHGLAVSTPHGWRVLSAEDGAPSGIIVGSLVDATGEFWFRVFGAGLVRWVGYGHWETVRKSDGLSEGLAWQTARSTDGSLWVSTDTGVDQLVQSGLSQHVGRVLEGSSFALAVGPGGKLWRSAKEGVRIFDPATGSDTSIELPTVDGIFHDAGHDMWLATRDGLFTVDASSGVPGRPVLRGSPRAHIADIISDGRGGVFYLASGRLRHMRPNGTDLLIGGPWPRNGFDAIALAMGPDGSIWIGGSSGLYRFTLSDDTITRSQSVDPPDIRTNTIEAIMVDHRGWIWIGTALGVSVFDGRRWVSADADSGLVSNDVDEGGLREDPDGSVWITTTQGLSHLRDPAWLFSDQPIKAVISAAELGRQPVTGKRLAFSNDALSLRFGTSSYGLERSIRFRYQLSGVDSDLVESSTGLVRYAFVPPGSHTLSVVAYDDLTHRSSPAVTLVVDVDYPWWRQWWAELLWIACAFMFVLAVMRIRFRAIEASREELKRRIAEATEKLRFDRLTGLYIRSEIEERLAQKLLPGAPGNELIVALIDIDHFKRVNDTYGHLGGDDVLRAMGRLVLRDIWDNEYAGRYGGEEILLILDDADGRGAERVLNLLHTIRGTPFNAAGHSIRVTCSIGLAWAISGDDWESLIGRADDALYEAKSSGRDQVAERRNGSLIPRSSTNERRTSQRVIWRSRSQ